MQLSLSNFIFSEILDDHREVINWLSAFFSIFDFVSFANLKFQVTQPASNGIFPAAALSKLNLARLFDFEKMDWKGNEDLKYLGRLKSNLLIYKDFLLRCLIVTLKLQRLTEMA